MRAALGRAALVAGVALFLLFGLLLALLPGRGAEEEHSVFSTKPDGLRALFLLCEALDIRAAAWSDAPGALEGHNALLFASEVPASPPEVPGTDPEASEARPLRRSRDLGHYRRFLEEGGTLFLAGVREDGLDFLREDLGLAGFDGLAVEKRGELAALARLPSGEELALGAAPEQAFSGEGQEGEVLARASDGSVLALVRSAGAGRVLLLALDAELFENSSLEEHPDHALLFVRLLEAAAGVERVLFDEYALGGWMPASLSSLAFSPQLAWLSVHLVLLLSVFLWRSAWSGPFPRDPAPLLAASPLLRAMGTGQMLARAGRWDVLGQLLARGALERWNARAGQRPPPAADGAAVDAAAIERNLRALARGDERLFRRARALFLERVPRDEAELARLDADLLAFEGELFASETRKTPPARGVRRLGSGS